MDVPGRLVNCENGAGTVSRESVLHRIVPPVEVSVQLRDKSERKDRLSANIGTDNDSLKTLGKSCQRTLFHRDSQGNWLRIKEQIHVSAKMCETLSHEEK